MQANEAKQRMRCSPVFSQRVIDSRSHIELADIGTGVSVATAMISLLGRDRLSHHKLPIKNENICPICYLLPMIDTFWAPIVQSQLKNNKGVPPI